MLSCRAVYVHSFVGVFCYFSRGFLRSFSMRCFAGVFLCVLSFEPSPCTVLLQKITVFCWALCVHSNAADFSPRNSARVSFHAHLRRSTFRAFFIRGCFAALFRRGFFSAPFRGNFSTDFFPGAFSVRLFARGYSVRSFV